MTTSGTTSFNPTIEEIIEEAYDRCGIETRSGYDLKTAKRSLNLLLQELQNQHLPIWKMVLTSQPLVEGTTAYTLASDIIDIDNVVLRRSSIDTTMSRLSRDEYQSRPNKDIKSRPSQFYYEKLITPVLHVYPAPENSTDAVRFYARERIEDIGAYSNTIDLPSNILPIIISGLAYNIAVKRAPDRLEFLKPLFDAELIKMQQEDTENVPVMLVPHV